MVPKVEFLQRQPQVREEGWERSHLHEVEECVCYRFIQSIQRPEIVVKSG